MDSPASNSPSGFIVYIYQSEIDVIHKYVEDPRHRVGDLFGLWTNSGNVVVHIAETSVCASTEQELENDLKRYVEKKHMLCHIGKWQYDASVTSTNPRDWSRKTIESYCGRGKGYEACVLLGFCGEKNEEIQPYLFLNGGTEHISATLKILSGNKSSDGISDNPLRNIPAIREMLEKRKTVEEKCKQHPVEGHRGRVLSASGVDSSPNTRVTYVASSLRQTQQSGNDLISPNNATSPQCEGHQPVSQSSGLHPRTSMSRSSNQSSETPTFLTSSAGETMLQEVVKEIYNRVGDAQSIDVQRNVSSGCIQLKFIINGAKCEIMFPKAFPEVPAKVLSYGLPNEPKQLNFKPSNTNEKLHTVASIIFAVELCSGLLHSQPSTSPSITTDCAQSAETVPQVDIPTSELDVSKDKALVTPVTQPQPSTNSSTTTDCAQSAKTVPSKANVPVSKLKDSKDEALVKFSIEVCEKVVETFALSNVDGGGGAVVNMQVKSRGKRAEVTFKHYKKIYLISILVEFPEKSAIIYHVDDLRRKYVVGPKRRGQTICNVSEIVQVIIKQCSCTPCFRARKG